MRVSVFQHLEANRILAADEFLVRINAKVEIVGKQIVVCPPLAIFAPQDVSAGRRGRRGWRLCCHYRGEHEQRQEGEAWCVV